MNDHIELLQQKLEDAKQRVRDTEREIADQTKANNLTVADVKTRRTSCNVSVHGAHPQHRLFGDVLRAICDGHSDPRGLAAAALGDGE